MAGRADEEAAAAAATTAADGDGISSIENSKKSLMERDRELLLVVVIFIATVGFQAGINPPGGVWQDDKHLTYQAGKSIMAEKNPSQFVTFIASVTVLMTCSLLQFLLLLREMPNNPMSVSRTFLYFTTGTAISVMASAYWSAIRSLTPEPLMPSIFIALISNLVGGVLVLCVLLYVQKRNWC